MLCDPVMISCWTVSTEGGRSRRRRRLLGPIFLICGLLLWNKTSSLMNFLCSKNQQSATRLSLMTESENEALISKANDCVGGECSLDEVGDLIDVLKAQQKELAERVKEVKKVIDTLEHVNEKDERKVDEVRETVRALFRVFQLGESLSIFLLISLGHFLVQPSLTRMHHR